MDTTAYPSRVPTWERPVITGLLTELFARGCKVAVHNGEEWASKRTTKIGSIRPNLNTADEDSLVVWNSEGERIGTFYLIYNNGSEHDPMTVVADYSWVDDETKDMFQEIWNILDKKYGG